MKNNQFIPSQAVLFALELYQRFSPLLDEPARRQFLACIVEQGGYGAQSYVQAVTGMNPHALERGHDEIQDKNLDTSSHRRQRKPGGGRKSIESIHPEIFDDLRMIIEDSTYGDPCKQFSYTTMSEAKIVEALDQEYGIHISDTKVGELLEPMGYSRQNNQKKCFRPGKKARTGTNNKTAEEFLKAGNPVLSVDTKKKENLGNFKNAGTEYCPKGKPRQVLDHDFLNKELGKVSPYGIYELNDNIGFVNLGTDHDTSDFAAESIRRWYWAIGHRTFPKAKKIYITCDSGGSNGSRSRLWKYDLTKLAEELDIEIWVSHYPPGTSKWNKVEHKLFCYISKNWQGKPLIDIETVVKVIGSTTTKAGLKVKCVVDEHKYPTGRKVADEELAAIDITQFGDNTGWNYIIKGFKH